jgi:cytochrome c553
MLAIGLAAAAPTAAQNDPAAIRPAPPPWAYTVNPPAPPSAPPARDDGTPKRLPGTSVTFTLTQLRDLFSVPDWRPDEHPPMPPVVAQGRKPDVMACGYCHLPNGQGRPENSSLAGLPARYIVQQMADYKDGLRRGSEPRMVPHTNMMKVGKAASDAEVKAAAEYFAGLTYKPWVRVVETDTVPKTRVSAWLLVPVEGGGTEPIGQRIIEVPEDPARTELRDPASGFVAYVPPGSIARGEALVTTGGGGKTVECGACHGEDLSGVRSVPPLVGRSPSYVVRQLYDFQSGARAGALSEQMKETVSKLTLEDMIAIAAYTASRRP